MTRNRWLLLAALLLTPTFALAVVPALRTTGVQVSSQTTCPVASGSAGIWNNSGVPKWRNADTTDSQIIPSGAANLVYASPNGSSGNASLRALAVNDIPSLAATYCSLTGCTYTGPVTFGGSLGISAGAFNVDWSNATGTIKIPTGGFASQLSLAGGSTFNIDWSNTSGVEKLPTGGIQVGSSTAAGKPVLAPWVGGTQTASSSSGQVIGDAFTIPANAIAATGSRLRCTSNWIHAANANSATVNVNFGGTNVCSTADSTSGDFGEHFVNIVRTGTTTADAYCIQGTAGFAAFKLQVTGLNYGASITVQNTINTTTGNGDATLHGMTCEVMNP